VDRAAAVVRHRTTATGFDEWSAIRSRPGTSACARAYEHCILCTAQPSRRRPGKTRMGAPSGLEPATPRRRGGRPRVGAADCADRVPGTVDWTRSHADNGSAALARIAQAQGHGVRASGLHARRGARPAAKHRPGNRRDRGTHRRRGRAQARSVRGAAIRRDLSRATSPFIGPPRLARSFRPAVDAARNLSAGPRRDGSDSRPAVRPARP
jgi:hypothetical protein